MARRPGSGPPALSAPGLIGPASIVNWGTSGPSRRRARRPKELARVALEVDLVPGTERLSRIPLLDRIEEALREAEVVEQGDLLYLAGGTLHAFASAGYRRIDHWELRPGGWLPLRNAPTGPQVEPIAQFLAALGEDQWKAFAGARGLAVRLSSPRGLRASFELRRVRRERGHTLSIEVSGRIPSEHVDALVAALHRRLPVLRAEVTRAEPAPRKG